MQLGASTPPLPPGLCCLRTGSCSLGPTTDATWPQPGSGVKGSDIAEVRGLKDALSYSSSSVSPRLCAVGLGQRWAGTPVRDPRLPHSPAHPRVASELWRGERAFALPPLCSALPSSPRPPPSLPPSPSRSFVRHRRGSAPLSQLLSLPFLPGPQPAPSVCPAPCAGQAAWMAGHTVTQRAPHAAPRIPGHSPGPAQPCTPGQQPQEAPGAAWRGAGRPGLVPAARLRPGGVPAAVQAWAAARLTRPRPCPQGSPGSSRTDRVVSGNGASSYPEASTGTAPGLVRWAGAGRARSAAWLRAAPRNRAVCSEPAAPRPSSAPWRPLPVE